MPRISDLFNQATRALQNVTRPVTNAINKEVQIVRDQARADRGDTFEPALPSGFEQARYVGVKRPLGVDKPVDAVHQGAIGDCYLLAAISAVAEKHPEQLANIVRDNKDGTYTVSMYEPVGLEQARFLGPAARGGFGVAEDLLSQLGTNLPLRKIEVTVDGTIPVQDHHAVGDFGQQLYPAIIEKAYARRWGGYDAIDAGHPAVTLAALTGKPVESSYPNIEGADATFARIAKLEQQGRCVVASSNPKTTEGVVPSHCYTVLGAVEQDAQRFVKVRNPWGAPKDGVELVPLATFVKNFGVVVAS